MSNIALKLNNVTVSFRSYKERPTSFKEYVVRLAKKGNQKYYSTFDALKNVSFDVPKGSVLGIIGSNGAGKSTLLKTMAGIIPPTSGQVITNGKLDSFIQLGAGFDAELNAIENIFLNCSLHKMPRSVIKKRIPDILDFAELTEFSTTPIKYYSSGMFARLGFAVAIERSPDILLVDEILSVGDERFRDKCDAVFDKYLSEGRTIIMVSHNLEKMREMSNKIALVSKGEIAFLGEPNVALKMYRDTDYKTALAGQ